MFVALILVTMPLNQAYAETPANSAAACFNRAERYEKEANKYANDVRDPRKWFDLAMKNYLCAARAGHVVAKWRVVNLSGSGQVKALPKEMEDRFLLEAAEAGLVRAQISMGNDFCDNGIGTTDPCKNPVEAKKWFLRAARTGYSGGAFRLGIFYEMGEGGKDTKRTDQALACYRLSVQHAQSAINAKGPKDLRELKSDLKLSRWGIERTLKELGGRETTTACY